MKILWVGDAEVNTGYTRLAQNFLPHFRVLGWQIAQLGIHYYGDPHGESHRIYPAQRTVDPQQDWGGVGRLRWVCDQEHPDWIVVNLDPWNIEPYRAAVAQIPEAQRPRIAGYVAVDGLNMKRSTANSLTGLDLTVFHTQFGLQQSAEGGFRGRYGIVGHGVDTDLYNPGDQREARKRIGIQDVAGPDTFLLGNVNRNQPRKRLDITIREFAHWLRDRNPGPNVRLYLHANNDDLGFDLRQLAQYYKLEPDRLILPAGDIIHQFGEEMMPDVYRSLDAMISTTSGEGWGLTTLESMACGIANAVPDFAALGEWPGQSVLKIPVEHADTSAGGVNTLNLNPMPKAVRYAIDNLYRDPEYRQALAREGLERARSPEFNWRNLAEKFSELLSS